MEDLTILEFAIKANLATLNSGVSRVMKKVRRRPELPVDTNDPTLDGNGQQIMEEATTKVAYKNKLWVCKI